MKVLILKSRQDYGPGFVQVGRTVSTAFGQGVALELSKGNWLHILGGPCHCYKCAGRTKPPNVIEPGEPPKKRRGRPPGSKNKTKEEVIEYSPQSLDVAPTED